MYLDFLVTYDLLPAPGPHLGPHLAFSHLHLHRLPSVVTVSGISLF